MASATVIRSATKGDDTAIVVTVTHAGGFKASFQSYTVLPDGRTVLAIESSWGDEQGAVKVWEDYVAAW